jgi:hypothetical protein
VALAGHSAGVAVHDVADVVTCTAIILELLQALVHMPDTLKSGEPEWPQTCFATSTVIFAWFI